MNKLCKNKINYSSDKIKLLRNRIDSIDHKIIKLIYRRLLVVEDLALFKIKNKMPLLQKKRFAHMLNERELFAQKLHIDKKITSQIIKLLHKISLSHQREFAAKIKNKKYIEKLKLTSRSKSKSKSKSRSRSRPRPRPNKSKSN